MVSLWSLRKDTEEEGLTCMSFGCLKKRYWSRATFLVGSCRGESSGGRSWDGYSNSPDAKMRFLRRCARGGIM